MKKISVGNKELDILDVLWNSPKPLTVTMICEANPNLNYNTVQSCIKKLSKKGLVEVGEIVYSGTVLTRSYQPLLSREEFILNQYQSLKISNLVSHFLGDLKTQEATSEVKELEELLKSKKK